MEESTFKLAVIAIVAIALLLLFLFQFGPLYIWKEKPVEVIEKNLQIAEVDLGHYHHQKTEFPEDFGIKADPFESTSRSIKFECNHDVLCCPEGEDCERVIEWDNNQQRRFFSFKLQKPAEVSARCRHEEIYICRVYIGEEPAQVDITRLELDSSLIDLTEKKTITVSYSVSNTGKQDMLGVQGKARLFKLKESKYSEEPERILVKEFSDEAVPLEIGEELEREIEVEINENGNYEIEFIVFEPLDETNYESAAMEVEAVGLVEIGECIPGEMEREYFSEEQCRYFFPCEDCKSIIECERKWREKYNLPVDFKFELRGSGNEVEGTIWLEVPGEHREECKRICYPEFEVIETMRESVSPIDLVFVIDASGSMSDDIEEVREVISNVYNEIGEDCKIGAGSGSVSAEPCIQIGLYLFEGTFKGCLETPENKFFRQCLRDEEVRGLFEDYPSKKYVVCDITMYYALDTYRQLKANPKARLYDTIGNDHTTSFLSKVERDFPASIRNKNSADFFPQTCRPNDTAFSFPSSGALYGQATDIGFIPITTDLEKITSALDEIVATQGEEAWADSLYFVLNSDEMNWRENAKKAIILITDASNNGAQKSLLAEVVPLAKEKETKIFGLAASGFDTYDQGLNAEINRYLTEYFGYPQALGSKANDPTYDLMQVSSGTGGSYKTYTNASELPQEILAIVKEQVEQATNEHGLNICGEGDTPEMCDERCVLPWEENCSNCTCFPYYAENSEEYAMLEVLFVLDASGSMMDEMDVMRSRIESVLETAEKECERIGLEKCMRISSRLVFGDPNSTPVFNLSHDTHAGKLFIQQAFHGGGDTAPDPWAGEALISAYTDSWQAESKKIMFILTDAKNDPEEIVSENYHGFVEEPALTEEIDPVVRQLGKFAKENRFKVFGIYSEKEGYGSPRHQLEWLAGESGGQAIQFETGTDFTETMAAVLREEIVKESEKSWCTDEQCEDCLYEAVSGSDVPIEWNYNYMCTWNSEECEVLMSCHVTPHEINLDECQRTWLERTGGQFEIRQELEQNWLFAEGKKMKEGIETGEEDWTECELPAITEQCGGVTVERGAAPTENQGNNSDGWIDAGTDTGTDPTDSGDDSEDSEPEEDDSADTGGTCAEESECSGIDCGEASCENPEKKCISGSCLCECPVEETGNEELECIIELGLEENCYCETGNDEFEYIDRIKQLEKPVDLLVVLDATESMYHEGAEFYEGFSELSEKMQGECVVEGQECLKIGVLGVGGGASTSAVGEVFYSVTASDLTELAKGIGIAALTSSPEGIIKIRNAIAGIEYKFESEPWADALFYAASPGNRNDVGWRSGTEKAVLLITSEVNSESVHSLQEARSLLESRSISVFSAVRNLSVNGRGPRQDAEILGGKIYTYKITKTGQPWLESEGRALKEVLKIFVKDFVEELIESKPGSINCTESECAECKT